MKKIEVERQESDIDKVNKTFLYSKCICGLCVLAQIQSTFQNRFLR